MRTQQLSSGMTRTPEVLVFSDPVARELREKQFMKILSARGFFKEV